MWMNFQSHGTCVSPTTLSLVTWSPHCQPQCHSCTPLPCLLQAATMLNSPLKYSRIKACPITSWLRAAHRSEADFTSPWIALSWLHVTEVALASPCIKCQWGPRSRGVFILSLCRMGMQVHSCPDWSISTVWIFASTLSASASFPHPPSLVFHKLPQCWTCCSSTQESRHAHHELASCHSQIWGWLHIALDCTWLTSHHWGRSGTTLYWVPVGFKASRSIPFLTWSEIPFCWMGMQVHSRPFWLTSSTYYW